LATMPVFVRDSRASVTSKTLAISTDPTNCMCGRDVNVRYSELEAYATLDYTQKAKDTSVATLRGADKKGLASQSQQSVAAKQQQCYSPAAIGSAGWTAASRACQ
jgi:hypothetical protein